MHCYKKKINIDALLYILLNVDFSKLQFVIPEYICITNKVLSHIIKYPTYIFFKCSVISLGTGPNVLKINQTQQII